MTRRPPLHALILIAALLAPPLAHRPSEAGTAPKPAASKETPLERIRRAVARINAEAKTPEGEAAVIRRLSGQLRVPEDELRAERDTWGIGYGEVAMVHAFAGAGRTGKTPAEVAAMRHEGMEWQAIAKELGVKVDAVATRMRRHARRSAAAPAR